MAETAQQVTDRQFKEELLDGLIKRKMLAQLLNEPEQNLIASENQLPRVDTFKNVPTSYGQMEDQTSVDYLSKPSIRYVRKPMYEALINTYFGGR